MIIFDIIESRQVAIRALGSLILLCGLSSSPLLQAKDTLYWSMRDLPPLTIEDGRERGQGPIDRLLPLLMAALPQYQHETLRMNRARTLQMLESDAFVCDPTMLWTEQRSRSILYSIPSLKVQSSGLVIRKADLDRFKGFMTQGELDLHALVTRSDIRLGVVSERSYGAWVDEQVRLTRADHRVIHHGNTAIPSLLRMERLGRIDAVIAHWPEAHYHALQQGIDLSTLSFLPVKGAARYQAFYVGCSNTPQGRAAMPAINAVLRSMRSDKLVELYASWLEPDARVRYLEDAKTFFTGADDTGNASQ